MNKIKNEVIVIGVGIILYISGIVLKLNASSIAWPSNYSFSGERADTIWAIKENTILCIGSSLLIFGMILVLISVVSILWNQKDRA